MYSRNNRGRELMVAMLLNSLEAVQPQKPLARSARSQATYQVCRSCGAMMIQAHKGGLECSAGCVSDTGIDFSGNREISDASR